MKAFLTLCAVTSAIAALFAIISGIIEPCETTDKQLTGLVHLVLSMHLWDWAQKS